MANHTSTTLTTASAEEVLVAAVQFFTSERFSTTSQTNRNVTFAGKPGFPCGMLVLVVIGYVCFIIPGIIMQLTLVRKLYKLHNLVVTATPAPPNTDVSINYPTWASGQVRKFMAGLPKPESTPAQPPALPS